MHTAAPARVDVEQVFDGVTHLQWAENIGRAIAHAKGFLPRSQEEHDLVSAAHLLLCRRATTFAAERVPLGGSAAGLFRGFCHQSIKWECLREASRMRAGGTFHSPSRAEAKEVRIQALPTMTNELGDDEVVVEDRRVAPEPDEVAEVVEEFGAAVCEARPAAAWMGCVRCGNRTKLRPDEPRECVRCGAALEFVQVAA